MACSTLRIRSIARWLATSIGFAASAYAAYVGIAWWRYGCVPVPRQEDKDLLLDRLLPIYEIAERHHIRVAAPAGITLAAARDFDLFQRPIVRAVFKARELILGSSAGNRRRPREMLAEAQSLGWVVLDEIPDREIVVGAVTKPWEANVTFRAIPADEFLAFQEPGYVKIAWTLRADPIGANESIFRTETRATATDPAARVKFRRYWSFLSPGIILIRWASLKPVRTEAERQAHLTTSASNRCDRSRREQ